MNSPSQTGISLNLSGGAGGGGGGATILIVPQLLPPPPPPKIWYKHAIIRHVETKQ